MDPVLEALRYVYDETELRGNVWKLLWTIENPIRYIVLT